MITNDNVLTGVMMTMDQPSNKRREAKGKPLVVNGVTYDNDEELQKRIEADAKAMAEFLYDRYIEEKRESKRS